MTTLPQRKPEAEPYVLDLSAIEGNVAWPQVFGNDHPVELEVGSGKGLFLQNAATRHPDRNFLGLELSRKYAAKAAERAAKYGLSNVKVWRGDAGHFLASRVPPRSLSAVHVYFPDPWWKARHKKRRVFNERLLSIIERSLLHGGELHVASDVEEYFGVMTDLIRERAEFRPVGIAAVESPQGEQDYLTNFERKYRIEGRPIYRAGYRLERAPDGADA